MSFSFFSMPSLGSSSLCNWNLCILLARFLCPSFGSQTVQVCSAAATIKCKRTSLGFYWFLTFFSTRIEKLTRITQTRVVKVHVFLFHYLMTHEMSDSTFAPQMLRWWWGNLESAPSFVLICFRVKSTTLFRTSAWLAIDGFLPGFIAKLLSYLSRNKLRTDHLKGTFNFFSISEFYEACFCCLLEVSNDCM